MLMVACVSSSVPIRSSQLDFKLWFLPHISTDAIRTATDAKLFCAISNELGPKVHKYQEKMRDYKMGLA